MARPRTATASVKGSSGRAGDLEMMRVIAELYYLRDWKQPEIAELTGFSISKVSRLLAQAREVGIVRISVDSPRAQLSPLASRLTDALGVPVELTVGGETSPIASAKLCGVAAARFVGDQLPDAGVLGITGGNTLAALTGNLPERSLSGLTVVPLIGGWDQENPALDSNQVVRRAAERLGATARLLHAPGYLESAATKEVLLRDSSIADTTRYWEDLDTAVIGLAGGPHTRAGYGTVMDRLDDAGRQRLMDKGVVGDVAGTLYTLDGTLVEDEWTTRTIAIPLALLRRTRQVIAVAAGPTKVDSIIGCARTGLIHTLITDERTAQAALDRL